MGDLNEGAETGGGGGGGGGVAEEAGVEEVVEAAVEEVGMVELVEAAVGGPPRAQAPRAGGWRGWGWRQRRRRGLVRRRGRRWRRGVAVAIAVAREGSERDHPIPLLCRLHLQFPSAPSCSQLNKAIPSLPPSHK